MTTMMVLVSESPRGNVRQIRYVPGTNMTPVLKGFEGEFIGVPNRQLQFEIWWVPLDWTG